ncbi:MAG: hypothetical protein HWD59_14955 [Coxiellaceae bacterium]|nr:MAG: hypothetical protein HWD59_14955 [Coxiellaceae bacterium]
MGHRKLGEAATQALETELTSRIVSDNLNDNNAAQPLITSAPHYTHFKPSQPKTELAVGELNDLMSSLCLQSIRHCLSNYLKS